MIKDPDEHTDSMEWRRVFYLIFVQDIKIWFQYKLIYRILGKNNQLYKMSMEKSDRCRFC